jgi:cytochrome c553
MMEGLRRGRWALAAALFVSTAFAQDRAELCVSCHGADGTSQTPGIPSIAGQPKLFLETQLVLFREELRAAPPEKQPAVKGLTDREIVRLAEHYAALPARPVTNESVGAVQAKQATALAQKLHCGSCHSSNFRGGQQIPRLASQREEYLVESMLAYRDNRRAGGDTIMAATLYGVSDADIRTLAYYLARLR